MKKLIFATLSLITLASLGFPARAFALSGNEFRAGRIIDDSVFYNPNTMNHIDAQNFLNSKLPTCDTNGAGSKSYYYNASTGRVGDNRDTWVTTTRAVYGERWDHWLNLNGKPTVGSKAPYTCLKSFTQNIPGITADSLCTLSIGSGKKTAAMIINDVAKACGINPRVLLVLLQKEQGFVSDDWPWGVQYTKATGYYCPDNPLDISVDSNRNNCHDEYEGFFKQVYYSARQYKRYRAEADIRPYRAGRYNNILFNPDANCGASDVFITNQATAGLYIYTPYQPNKAALDDLYGNGDLANPAWPECSAFGNRNFWRLYNDWFGSTITDFKWYADVYQIWNKSESQRIDPGKLLPGEEYIVKIFATNTGSATWYNNGPTPVLFGTASPEGRDSELCHSSWPACNRPALLGEKSIAPGQGADFKFRIRAPYRPGYHREYFKPVAEMLTWFNGINEGLGINVISFGSFTWSTAEYQIFDESETLRLDPGKLRTNTRYVVKLQAKNTGTATWRNNGPTPVRIGTNYPPGKSSLLCDSETWLWCGRPASLVESIVTPGQSGNFKFLIRTPSTPGAYREYFKPVAEYYSWFNDVSESLGIIVK